MKIYCNVYGNIVFADQLMTEQYRAVQFSSQVLPRGKIKIEAECKLTIALGTRIICNNSKLQSHSTLSSLAVLQSCANFGINSVFDS